MATVTVDQEFASVMAEYDLQLGDVVADGKLHRSDSPKAARDALRPELVAPQAGNRCASARRCD